MNEARTTMYKCNFDALNLAKDSLTLLTHLYVHNQPYLPVNLFI